MSVRAGILIGGLSSRMGSPKHLLTWQNATLAEYLVETLEPHVDSVAFLGEGKLPKAVSDRLQIIDDPNVKGPLSGILSALRTGPCTEGGAWLITGCDLPLMTSSAVQWLLKQRSSDAAMVIPRDSQGVPQPHFAIYEQQSITFVERAVEEGVRSPRTFVHHPGTASPLLPSWVESELLNVNSPDDLRAVREGL